MSAPGPIEYRDAIPAVRAVFDDIKRTRITVESSQHRTDTMEIQLSTLSRWFKAAAIGIILLLAALILLVAELIHAH